MSCFRTCPSDIPGESRMEFDYYFNGETENFEKYFNFTRQVALEDYDLCVAAQKNLERGIYCEGVLNPIKENGVICKFINLLFISTLFIADLDITI